MIVLLGSYASRLLSRLACCLSHHHNCIVCISSCSHLTNVEIDSSRAHVLCEAVLLPFFVLLDRQKRRGLIEDERDACALLRHDTI